eukprot:10740-Heterococcus_DN1.PRE.3
MAPMLETQERQARERARINISITKAILNRDVDRLSERLAMQEAELCKLPLPILRPQYALETPDPANPTKQTMEHYHNYKLAITACATKVCWCVTDRILLYVWSYNNMLTTLLSTGMKPRSVSTFMI